VSQEDIEDKKQIGTSALAKELMKRSIMRDHFSLQQDMIKFAVCVALANHLSPEDDRSTHDNSQRTSDLDPNEDLKFLVESYERKTTTPYRLIESLAEAGFRHIDQKLNEGRTLEQIIRGH
jgi:hypothetical protein